MSGKGSTMRPLGVSQSRFIENWDKIFSQSNKDVSSDWYLLAINPWHKWYYNPKTNETRHISYK